ncbi:hypothetical protein FH972_026621 [Carpinus fangiana]|uniref:Uncharacterized protein n=1 Tax=Carpinus fangiana TaxID=176857 RepID=A0A5N6L4I6_9ROSI|nr:hypothetical protein FH972_026621 [Carpinus fangiana]
MSSSRSAYFNKLLENISKDADNQGKPDYDYVVGTITAIKAQEELHALGVNAALQAAGRPTVAPCKYLIPDLSFVEAITLANTFTDVVLGVLPQAQTVFAADGAKELPYVNLFGSVIAQEAEQNGVFRSVQRKIASSAPFKTTEGPTFAFSFLKSFIAPGCPVVDLVGKYVPSYAPLTVAPKGAAPGASDNNGLYFSVPGKVTAAEHQIYYITGQNVPISDDLYEVVYSNRVTTFRAKFPFASGGFTKGLTIAALVKKGTYTTIADVAANTLYGPGIIEVQ